MEQLSIRALEIIRLLADETTAVTSDKLASALQVTPRTIKQDIKLIMGLQDSFGFELKSVIGKGYLLHILDYKKYQAIVDRMYAHSDYNSNSHRIHTIIRRLLLSNVCISSHELAQEMYVSQSTLNSDIRSARKVLKEEGLELYGLANKGFAIRGNEVDIRRAISKFIDVDIFSIESYNQFFGTQVLDYRRIRQLTDDFINIFRDYNNDFLGISITNILIHIIIAINRITNGNSIDLKDHITHEETREFEIATRISEVIERELTVKLSEKEVNYLAYCLIGKGLYHYDNLAVKHFISVVYSTINKVFSLELNQNEDYSKTLYYHTMALLDRLKFGIEIEEEATIKRVNSNFVFEYELALIYKQEFYQVYHVEISEVEVSYVALHFGAVLENIRLSKTLPKMILITEARPSQALMIKNELISHFKTSIHVLNVYSPYEIKTLDLKKMNYVVSTSKIPFLNPSRYLLISEKLSKVDFDKLDAYVSNEAKLVKIFDRHLFVKEIKGTNYHECLIELGKLYYRQGVIDDFDLYLENSIEREKLQSTRAGYILAFPHSLVPIARKNFISVAISRQGVKWIDGGIVKIMLYVGLKDLEKHEFEYVFGLLSKITSNRELIDQLVVTDSFEDFIHTLTYGMKKRIEGESWNG